MYEEEFVPAHRRFHIEAADRALKEAYHFACVSGPDIGSVIPLGGNFGNAQVTTLIDRPASGRWASLFFNRDRVWLHYDDASLSVHIRHRLTTWLHVHPHQPTRIFPGSKIRINDNEFIVRPRPQQLHWPEPPKRTRQLWMLIPTAFMVVFMVWRFVKIIGVLPVPPIVITAPLCVLIIVIAAVFYERRYGKWREKDGAFLALVLATHSLGQAVPTGGPLYVWPHRLRAGRQARTVLESHHHSQDPSCIKAVGFIGPQASLAAKWWAAQIAARIGGATIACEDGTRWNIAVPQADIHISSTDRCPWCTPPILATRRDNPRDNAGEIPQNSAPALSAQRPVFHDSAVSTQPLPSPSTAVTAPMLSAGLPPPSRHDMRADAPHADARASQRMFHIGIGQDYQQLPPWCDSVFPADSSCVSMKWWRQCAQPTQHHPTDLTEQAPRWNSLNDVLQFPGCIGIERGRPCYLDLLTDGPHALIAGSTGCGKSAALTTWLLSMYARYSPDQLRLILIDYKGGAAFRPLTGLLHTECVLTDLEPDMTSRALRGISALLIRRESLLAAHSFPDVATWHRAYLASTGSNQRIPAPPPHIIIAIDEFRILREGHAESMNTLMRLAAQGRSLGLHVIAATQRPSGAVDASMRANMELRIAFRQVSPADSLDVIGSAEASTLPKYPGVAVIADRGTVHFAYIPHPARIVQEINEQYPQIAAELTPLWPDVIPRDLSWQDLDLLASEQSLDSAVRTVPIGLADGIEEGEHQVVWWTGESIRYECPSDMRGQASIWVSSTAHRISKKFNVPLHHCGDRPLRGAASRIGMNDVAEFVALLEEVPHHPPCVIAIDNLPAILHEVSQRIGPVQMELLWQRFGEKILGLDIVLVYATPGIFSSPHMKIPGPHTRIIHAPTSASMLSAALPSSLKPTVRSGETLLVSFGSAKPREMFIPLASLNTPTALAADVPPPWGIRPLSRARSSRRENSGVCALVGNQWEIYAPSSPLPWVVIAPSKDILQWIHSFHNVRRWEAPEIRDVVSPHAWPRFEPWRGCRVIAVDPSPDVVKSLMRLSKDAPLSLLARTWDTRTGVLMEDDTLRCISIMDS